MLAPDDPRERPVLTPTLQRFIAACVALAGVFLVVVGAHMWIRTEGLSSRAVVTTATLTDVRERGDSDTGIVATYAFEVSGATFHHVGLFGEVPADITPEQAAAPSRTIPVRYLPDDPWVNEPVSDVTPSATRQLFAIVIGLGMIVAAAVRWMLARRAVVRTT